MAKVCFTDEEAKRFGFEGKTESEILQELGEMGNDLSIAIRQNKIDAIVYGRANRNIMNYRDNNGRIDPQRGLESFLYTDRREMPRIDAEGKGYGGDLDNKLQVINNHYQGRIYQIMEKLQPRIAGLKTQKKSMEQLVHAIYGDVRDADFKDMATELSSVFDDMRTRFNQAGGNVKVLDNWLLPQNHDAQTIRKMGFDAWYADVNDFADLNRMGMLKEGVDTKEEMRKVFYTLTTDGLSKVDVKYEATAFGVSQKLANSQPFKRFIIFKDAQSWINYNNKYSNTDAFNAITDHIQNMSNDIGLLENLGSNPDRMFESLTLSVQAEVSRQQQLTGVDVERLTKDVNSLKNKIDSESLKIERSDRAQARLDDKLTVLKREKFVLKEINQRETRQSKKTHTAGKKSIAAKESAKAAATKDKAQITQVKALRKDLKDVTKKLSIGVKKASDKKKITALSNQQKVINNKLTRAIKKQETTGKNAVDFDRLAAKADKLDKVEKKNLKAVIKARKDKENKVFETSSHIEQLNAQLDNFKQAKTNKAKFSRELTAKERQLDSDILIASGKVKAKKLGQNPKNSTDRAKNTYDNIAGRLDPVNSKISDAMAGIRNYTVAVKLPMAVVSAPTDLIINGLTANYNGFSGMKTIKDAITMLAQPGNILKGQENRELAARLSMSLDFMSDIAHNANRYSDVVGKSWPSKAAAFTLKAGGLNHWTVTNKMAFVFNFSQALARKDLASNRLMMASFKRYGIDESDLKHILNNETFEKNGQIYLELRALRRETAEKVAAMINAETKKGVLEPDSRIRGYLNQGSKRGTIQGELLRFAIMFKSFPMSMIFNQWSRVLYGNGLNTGGRIGYGFNLLVGTSLLGVMSVQALKISKGEETAPWDSKALWKEGFLKGGGMSILGDLFSSDLRKYGSLADFAAGPAISMANDIFWKGALGNIDDAAKSDRDLQSMFRRTASESAKYVPGQFFYSKLVMDRVFLDELKRFGDENYDHKKRERAKKKMQHYENERW